MVSNTGMDTDVYLLLSMLKIIYMYHFVNPYVKVFIDASTNSLLM